MTRMTFRYFCALQGSLGPSQQAHSPGREDYVSEEHNGAHDVTEGEG